MPIPFTEKLATAWHTRNSLLCIGLDPELTKINAAHWPTSSQTLFDFCKAIVDATADLVCAFKPQIAYFAAERAEDQLEALCGYIHQTYPDIPLILDAKRGDIGATSEQYAREAFERYRADAVTVNPYMGFDAIAPYLEWQNRGVIVLCRTSNVHSAEVQCLRVDDGQPLYQHIARLVAEKWNTHGQCGLVVGATFPKELAQVRALVGDMPLLVPGIGAQGGDIQATVSAGQTKDGTGMIINSSRGILYAAPSVGETSLQASRTAAKRLRDEINGVRWQQR